MATAKIVKARKSKFSRSCDKCHEPILVGQEVANWSFRYGGDHYQHVACGPVRRSQLTQSKLSAVYSAMEDASDQLDQLVPESYLDAVEEIFADVESIVGSVAEAAREVETEYRDAAEAMGDAGSENEERADELDSWASDLEGFSSGETEPVRDDAAAVEDDPDCDVVLVWTEQVNEYLIAVLDEAREAIDACPL